MRNPGTERAVGGEASRSTTKAQTRTTEVPGTTRHDARRALVAAGIGWGLDGLTWTMYSFALTVVLPVLGISNSEAGWITAASIVASAVGGVVCGGLADRFG